MFFTAEAVLKAVGMGFIMEKNTYLRDSWNWLDFIVVVTGLLSFHPSMANVSALRTFRLFRPLKSLSVLPSMQNLVNTLLTSIVQLSNVMALMLFFFLIFGILGMNL